ncbi:MAG: Rossmann-like and DUF2520 domain-containing protein [Pyrinomonadaceae bacterium]
MASIKRKSQRRRLRKSPDNTNSVSIIGAGRLGLALGTALTKAGYAINLVVARTAASANHAGTLLRTNSEYVGAKGLSRLPRQSLQLIEFSSVVFVATPDDAIPGVAQQLADVLKFLRAADGQSAGPPVVLHTSGALSSRALQPLKTHGRSLGSIHPLISISDKNGLTNFLSGAFFSLEGDPIAIRVAKRIVQDLGGKAFIIDARSKPLYHAAAVMASPNVTALFDMALAMLGRCGISAAQARQIFLPLVISTVKNLVDQDPTRALTGTFKRGDIATARKHISAIESVGLTDALGAYAVLGRHSLNLSGLPRARRAEIERLLTRALKRAVKAY